MVMARLRVQHARRITSDCTKKIRSGHVAPYYKSAPKGDVMNMM